MTPKQIVYSPHAVRRLRERRISRQEVRTVIAIGTRSEAKNGGQAKTARLGTREIRVIFREHRALIHVWTVMLVIR